MLYKTHNPHGGDIYDEHILLDYSANINPYGAPRGVRDAISRELTNLHHYPDPYCRNLVRAIADFEEVSEEFILCSNGAAELIYSFCETVRPSRAVELAPTFSEYTKALKKTDCQIVRYMLNRDNCFNLDEGFLNFLNEQKPNAVFLCNPNNPTGKTIALPLLLRILTFCRENNINLFVDECFIDLSDDGVSLKGCLSDYPQLCILKAFTKSYAMAGVRLGYCLCSNFDLLKKMSQTIQPWNVSLLAQAAGIAALQETGFLQKTRKLIKEERKWLEDELKNLGFWVCPSKANYLLFYGKADLHTKLKKHGIAIRSCDNYNGLGCGWYRIAVRLHEENERLTAAIKQVCGKG